jgi:hypothetical protein
MIAMQLSFAIVQIILIVGVSRASLVNSETNLDFWE